MAIPMSHVPTSIFSSVASHELVKKLHHSLKIPHTFWGGIHPKQLNMLYLSLEFLGIWKKPLLNIVELLCPHPKLSPLHGICVINHLQISHCQASLCVLDFHLALSPSTILECFHFLRQRWVAQPWVQAPKKFDRGTPKDAKKMPIVTANTQASCSWRSKIRRDRRYRS